MQIHISVKHIFFDQSHFIIIIYNSSNCFPIQKTLFAVDLCFLKLKTERIFLSGLKKRYVYGYTLYDHYTIYIAKFVFHIVLYFVRQNYFN